MLKVALKGYWDKYRQAVIAASLTALTGTTVVAFEQARQKALQPWDDHNTLVSQGIKLDTALAIVRRVDQRLNYHITREDANWQELEIERGKWEVWRESAMDRLEKVERRTGIAAGEYEVDEYRLTYQVPRDNTRTTPIQSVTHAPTQLAH